MVGVRAPRTDQTQSLTAYVCLGTTSRRMSSRPEAPPNTYSNISFNCPRRDRPQLRIRPRSANVRHGYVLFAFWHMCWQRRRLLPERCGAGYHEFFAFRMLVDLAMKVRGGDWARGCFAVAYRQLRRCVSPQYVHICLYYLTLGATMQRSRGHVRDRSDHIHN